MDIVTFKERTENGRKLVLYTSNACVNCPPAKEVVVGFKDVVQVLTTENMKLAISQRVFTVPEVHIMEDGVTVKVLKNEEITRENLIGLGFREV